MQTSLSVHVFILPKNQLPALCSRISVFSLSQQQVIWSRDTTLEQKGEEEDSVKIARKKWTGPYSFKGHFFYNIQPENCPRLL